MERFWLMLASAALAGFAGCAGPDQDARTGVHLVDDLATWSGTDRSVVNAVIEIPAWTRAKWEVDRVGGDLRWDMLDGRRRVIGHALPYPANYGMIPRTIESEAKGGDGDPLDVIVLGDRLERGQVVSARVIGIMRMRDHGETDDKIIAVHLADTRVGSLETLEELARRYPGTVEILEIWFANYKCKTPGVVEILGSEGAISGRLAVQEAHADYGRLDR